MPGIKLFILQPTRQLLAENNLIGSSDKRLGLSHFKNRNAELIHLVASEHVQQERATELFWEA